MAYEMKEELSLDTLRLEGDDEDIVDLGAPDAALKQQGV